MKRLFVLCLLAGCAPSAELEPSADYLAHRSAIVGGTIDHGDPAVVAVAVESMQFCTGTLIAPQTVLTAAHCIYSYGQDYDYYVLFGTESDSPTQYVKVTAQYRHPDYSGSGNGFDIGVLRLSKPVTNVKPIAPNPTPLSQAYVGDPIRHVGFGVTSGSGSGGGTKRQVTYNVRQIGAYEIESGASGKQTCGGDSGGPAFMITAGSNEERVAGVVSYGDADCNQFGIDSRVDIALNWIEQTSSVWEVPTCGEDGKCLQGCTPVDQDCACADDGVCGASCNDVVKDPDCPMNCAANGVCATEDCPRPDPDCVPEGTTCTRQEDCKSRQCVSDPQHPTFYCSRPCATANDCPTGMECSAAHLCMFPLKPEVQLNELCGPDVYCRDSICTGPQGGPLRCARSCSVAADCPSGQPCEVGIDGQSYCRMAEPPQVSKSNQRILPKAPNQLPAAGGCSSAGGGPLGLVWALALAALGLRRRGA